MTLDEIAIKHGCDKSSIHHDYCRIYEQYFTDNMQSGEYNRLTEIGYFEGASAKMWMEWLCPHYPKFSTYCISIIDIEYKRPIEGINFIHSDAKNPKLATNPFVIGSDIIIDDGSHLNADIIAAFKNLWPVLNPGGLYCVEDVHSSYDPYYEDSSVFPGEDGTAMRFFTDLTHAVNSDFIDPQYQYLCDLEGYRNIEFIHFYKDLIIIKKKAA